MTLDSESFLALCRELRKLGATHIEGFGFAADFEPRRRKTSPVVVLPTSAQAQTRSKRVPPPSSHGAVPERLTPERIAELREEQYARELGR